MKIVRVIGITIGIALFLGGVMFYRNHSKLKSECSKLKLEKKYLLTKYDSILALPPDTLILPPKIIKGESIYRYRSFENKENEYCMNTYRDSIINDSIHINIKIRANVLDSIEYSYKPIYKYQERIVNKYVPKPFEVVREVSVNSRGLFLIGGVGYSDLFSSKLGLMYLTKKQNTLSYELIRYQSSNIHMVSYGFKIH